MQNLIKKLSSNHLLKRSHDENKESETLILNKDNTSFSRKRSALTDISNNFSLKNHNNKNESYLKRKDLKNLLLKDSHKSKLKSKFRSSLNQLRHNHNSNIPITNSYQNVNSQDTSNTHNINNSLLHKTDFINENGHIQQRSTLASSNNSIKVSHNYFQLNNKIQSQNENNDTKNILKRKEDMRNNNDKNENLFKKYKKIDSYCVNTKKGIDSRMRSNNNQEQREYINPTYRLGINNINQNSNNSILMESNVNGYSNGDVIQTMNSQNNPTILQTIKKGVKRSRPSFSPDGKFSVSNKTLFSPKVKRFSGQPKDISNSSSSMMNIDSVQKTQNYQSNFSEPSEQFNSCINSNDINNQSNSLVTILNGIQNESNKIDNHIINLKRKRSCSSIHSIAVELKKRHSNNNNNSINNNNSLSNQDRETISNTIKNSTSMFNQPQNGHSLKSLGGSMNHLTKTNSMVNLSSLNHKNSNEMMTAFTTCASLPNSAVQNKYAKPEWNQEKKLKGDNFTFNVPKVSDKLLKNTSTTTQVPIKNMKRHRHSPSNFSQPSISNYYSKLHRPTTSINHNTNIIPLNQHKPSINSIENRYDVKKNKIMETPLQKENSALTLVNNSVSMQQIPNSNNRILDVLNSNKKRNSLLASYKKSISNISSSYQKGDSILGDHKQSYSQENSMLKPTVNPNESYQKSNSLISSTSTLLNSFSLNAPSNPSTIDRALNTTDREKSFMHYLKTNTNTNITINTNQNSAKVKKVVYDPISLSEYSSDIYKYMKDLEIKMLPDPNYIEHQQEVTWSARTILINWIAEVHWKFRMQPETLYLTVNIIDRFLSVKSIKLNKFQLLGLCSLLISAKYEETVVPSIKDLVYMVNNMYTNEEIIQAERCVLVLLGFDLGYPGPMNFLRRISKADGYDTKTRTLAKYLIEITLLDEHFVNCPPSVVASAAVLLARKILLNDHNWNKLFIYYSGYNENLLIPVAQNIINYALPKAEHQQLPFIKKKYSIDSFKKVSLYVSQWVKKQCEIEKCKQTEKK